MEEHKNTAEQGWNLLKQDLHNWFIRRKQKGPLKEVPLVLNKEQHTHFKVLSISKTIILICVLIIVTILGLQMATYGLGWW